MPGALANKQMKKYSFNWKKTNVFSAFFSL